MFLRFTFGLGMLLLPGLLRAQSPQWPALKPYQKQARWSAPSLDAENYRQWIKSIWPSEEELKWQKIRWHKTLAEAAKEAKRLQRPILLWTMNGHPCGET